ncbi:MAG: PEGA domain-containing protein [Elusimicrobia bacterium]|nr:PEGA domain-containing protein [Elusimicrobiota bacterium]
MRLNTVRRVSLGLAGTMLAGCATIINQTTQAIGISSSPIGASVTVDGVPHGKTPVVAKLSRKNHHFVRIELAGYQPYEAALTRHVSGWVWGNIVFGGLIGLAIDALTGGLYKLTPDQIVAQLQKGDQASLLQEGGLYIAVVLSPDLEWQKIGQLQKTSGLQEKNAQGG